jgi:hypothetical protein
MSTAAIIILIDRGDWDFVGQQFFKDDITSFIYIIHLRLFLTYNFWKNRQQATRKKSKSAQATNASF